jgi:3',5'-cyclic AMP phosphodiesterase CpdA
MRDPNDTSHDGDGVDRRGFLRCMAWAGTGLVWTAGGGLLTSRAFGQGPGRADTGGFSFVQLSDSHIGFAKAPNQDVVGTLRRAIARINALPEPPAFVIHTGDLTHLSRPAEFDAVAEILKEARAGRVYYVPGEHDVIGGGRPYLARFGKGTRGAGWRSFDHHGVHFVGLVNVASPDQPGGLGALGREQLDWLKKDVAALTDSTPIVVFAHVPLWTIYSEWGWGTEDSQQALAALRRFGSVTVLNGHIHQVLQKVEGKITFHTARSTAFPQPAPGQAAGPGPLRDVPAGKLLGMLGLTSVRYVEAKGPLAVIDATLDEAPAR